MLLSFDGNPMGRACVKMSCEVVVTGLGVVTSIGSDVTDFWSAAISGQSGIRRIVAFDAHAHKSKVAGEVIGFDVGKFTRDGDVVQTDRFAQFGFAAACMAIEDANIQDEYDPYRFAVCIGSGMGGYPTFESTAKAHLLENKTPHPKTVTKIMANAAASHIGLHFGFKGSSTTISTACSSGGHAIGHAVDLIRQGRADAVLAGGAEAPVLPLTMEAFGSLRTLSTAFNDRPEQASRPFDKSRDGFVMGEGAAALCLERIDKAEKRNAKIYAKIIGYGATNEAQHMVMPDKTGNEAAATMLQALYDARITDDRVDYINAHATSTLVGDIAETNGIKQVFGQRAYQIPVNSTKSLIGHTIGAAGAIEALSTILSLHTGFVHPTINLEEADRQCDLDYVPNSPRKVDPAVAISNSFGFGGSNAVLVFGKYE